MFFGADVVGFNGDPAPTVMHHPFEPDKSLDLSAMKHEPLLLPVMDAGKIVENQASLKDISYYSTERLKRLPQEYKRFYNPHLYKVGIGTDLKEERNKLRKQYKSS